VKIYELEVSNYKSLENYRMPLRFDDLNLFIGENDSGKTAMLEAIQILFGYLEVNQIDFLNLKARLSEVRQKFLEDRMRLVDLGSMGPDHGPDLVEFEERLDLLREHSFYEDLRNFYLDYKDNFTIVFEKVFKKESNKIILKREIYFSYPTTKNKYLDKLLKNKDFIDYMIKSVKEINDVFNKIHSLKGNESEDDVGELYFYYQDIHDVDISYRIEKLINSKLYSNCSWKIQEYLSGDEPIEYGIPSISLPLEKLATDDLGLGPYNPYLNYFGAIDLGIEKISQIIYKDNFEALLNIDKSRKDETVEKDIYNYLNNALKNYIFEKVFNSKESQKYFNEIKDNLNILMDRLNQNKTSLNIDFELQSPSRISKCLEPTLKLQSLERGREIDVSNKSQGYLRKLLISDFLLLTKNIGLENENGRIILIEEPEIHMHINAQKEIISVLKENLLEGNSQAFITTHSHTMMEGMDLDNIYVFQKDLIAGTANIRNLKQVSIFNREELIGELISSLGIKNTDLLFLKKIILLLEGPHDVAFIKGLCKRPEISIDYEKILFKHTTGQASIFYYAGLGEFLNLKTMIISI